MRLGGARQVTPKTYRLRAERKLKKRYTTQAIASPTPPKGDSYISIYFKKSLRQNTFLGSFSQHGKKSKSMKTDKEGTNCHYWQHYLKTVKLH